MRYVEGMLTSRGSLLFFLPLLLMTGCPRNAIFTLEYELPRPPETITGDCYAEAGENLPVFARLELLTGYDDDPSYFRTERMDISSGESPYTAVSWSASSAPSIELSRTSQTTLVVDLESTEQHEFVHARLRFCASDDCRCEDGLEQGTTSVPLQERQEVWFSYERPFYIGERTRHESTVDRIQAANFNDDEDDDYGDCGVSGGDRTECEPQFIGRCEIDGCLNGNATRFCEGDDAGPHYCER